MPYVLNIFILSVPTAEILGGPDLHVDKGSTINLTCSIRFSPEPPAYIFWYHYDDVSNISFASLVSCEDALSAFCDYNTWETCSAMLTLENPAAPPSKATQYVHKSGISSAGLNFVSQQTGIGISTATFLLSSLTLRARSYIGAILQKP